MNDYFNKKQKIFIYQYFIFNQLMTIFNKIKTYF